MRTALEETLGAKPAISFFRTKGGTSNPAKSHSKTTNDGALLVYNLDMEYAGRNLQYSDHHQHTKHPKNVSTLKSKHKPKNSETKQNTQAHKHYTHHSALILASSNQTGTRIVESTGMVTKQIRTYIAHILSYTYESLRLLCFGCLCERPLRNHNFETTTSKR